MVGFCFVFLALVHRLLRRMYYNDHILVRHHGGHLLPVEESENEEETADEEDTGDELGTEDEEGTGDEEVAVFETSTQLAENPQEESEWAAAGEFSAGPPFQRKQLNICMKPLMMRVRTKKKSLTKIKKAPKHIWTQQTAGNSAVCFIIAASFSYGRYRN
ncbi:Cancer/testis antigen 47B [Manis javanica]|nr:Cancer/testis antigen 47B [Manis javanica]